MGALNEANREAWGLSRARTQASDRGWSLPQWRPHPEEQGCSTEGQPGTATASGGGRQRARAGGVGSGRVNPRGAGSPKGDSGHRAEGSLLFRGAALREREPAASPTPQGHTHSFPWAMVLGVTQRGEEAHAATRGSHSGGHKGGHMLLSHVGGCKQGLIWRGTWSILGQGSRYPGPRAVSEDQGNWAAARTMCYTPRAGG